MQSLSPELKTKAQIFKRMHDPTMPEGRWHPADEVLSSTPFLLPFFSLPPIHHLFFSNQSDFSATSAVPSMTTA
jgi:hypothetical protein